MRADLIVSGEKYEAKSEERDYNKFMVLIIHNVTRNDFGSYRCVAKNSLGETDGLIKLEGTGHKKTFEKKKKTVENKTNFSVFYFINFTENPAPLMTTVSAMINFNQKKGKMCISFTKNMKNKLTKLIFETIIIVSTYFRHFYNTNVINTKILIKE